MKEEQVIPQIKVNGNDTRSQEVIENEIDDIPAEFTLFFLLFSEAHFKVFQNFCLLGWFYQGIGKVLGHILGSLD